MAIEYNDSVLRKKLIEVYRKFIENPSDQSNLDRIRELDEKYEPLTAANDYISSQPIPKEIEQGVGFLSKMWADSFIANKEELIEEAKKILKELENLK